MAKGPKYRVPFRRRREGKTNYHRRLRLIRSKSDRLVIRCSKKHTTVQVVKNNIDGDIVLAQSHSTQLQKKFNWKFNTGNIPSAYLTGYLCGLSAKKAGIEEAILDLGIFVHNNRVKSAFKGFLDSGVEVNHNEDWFPKGLEERISGTHIENYAKLLSKEDKKLYNQRFSETLKNKGDPTKFVAEFNKIKSQIEKAV